MTTPVISENIEPAPKITLRNEILREVRDHNLWPQWSRVLIVDPGQYRASSSIGMVAALEQAGICPSDFDHIVVSSSGVFAGVGFALWRGVKMLNYCQEHWPSETIRLNLDTITKGTVLQTEKLLTGMLTGGEIHNQKEWYSHPVLPDNYHDIIQDNGRKNPVIHVVTSTTGSNARPHYIRSDEVSPLDFQKALAATLTLPRWSESEEKNRRDIQGVKYIDGFLTGEVMYAYAKDLLGASHVVKLGNSNGPHLPPKNDAQLDWEKELKRDATEIPIHIRLWLKEHPILAKFFCHDAPESNANEMQRMFEDAEKGKVKLLYVEPYKDAFNSPTFTIMQKGFVSNVGLWRARMEKAITSLHDPLPTLRYQEEWFTQWLIWATKASVRWICEMIDLHRY